MNETIAIIGSGMIGAQVARLAVAAGLNVVICNSRGPETLSQLVAELGPNVRASTLEGAVAATNLLVLAIPFAAYSKLPVETFAGKIVVDTLNYYPQRDGVMAEVKTDVVATSELVQKHLAKSHVVRGLSNMDFVRLLTNARPKGAANRSALPIAGDNPEAKATVTEFLDKIGYDVVDMGPIRESWRSEPTMPVYVHPYISPEASYMSHSVDMETFLAAPGRSVSTAEVVQLLSAAVRHDRMFGTLPEFAPSKN